MVLVPAGGLRLNVEDDLHSDGRPAAVLLHGFTGSLEDWDDVAPLLRRRFRVVALDLPGHGRSDAPDDPAPYSTEAMARHVASALEAARITGATVVGYSLGARVAMRLALGRPDLVHALVLEGASPGMEGAEREQRLKDDAALAALLEKGIEPFVDAWMARPFLAPERAKVGERAWAWARADRLKRSPVGLRWTLLRAGQAAEEPLWARLPSLAQPTRLVVGEEDAKYRALAERMAGAMPRATVAVVPGCGHAPHREDPAPFLAAAFG